MSRIIELQNLKKVYKSNENELVVLSEINLNIEKGEIVAIIGPSGSGKTTLLGLCAGLDTPTAGAILINGKDISNLEEDNKAELRANEIGFIFQNFQLLPTLTALENVMIPMELKSMSNIRERAKSLLERVGLKERINHYPSQLSGGEQQRVSLARAFGNEPVILFADEPTGNLDGETAKQIESLMFDLNKEQGTTLVIVTHNYELAAKAQRVISMKNGKIVSDQYNDVNQ
jgi:putative ABC transport system ATP-binding protein